MRAPVAALVTLIVAAPMVSATTGEGEFLVQGPLMLPTATAADGELLAAFVGQTGGGMGFHATTGMMRVHAFERTIRSVDGLPLPGLSMGYTERSWTVEAATLRLMEGGRHEGTLGYYPESEASFAFTVTDPASVETRTNSTLGNADAQDDETPTNWRVYQRVNEPHTLTTGAGTSSFNGRGALKVFGLDFEILSATNTTRHLTGERETSPTDVVFSWVYLELLAPATVTTSIPAGFELATRDVVLDGAGELRFRPIRGELHLGGVTYVPAWGKHAGLRGEFRGLLTPERSGSVGALRVSGDLTPSAAFTPAPMPPPTDAPSSPLWTFLLIGAVLAPAGAIAILVQRRRRVKPMPRRAASGPLRTLPEIRLTRRLIGYENLLASVRAGEIEKDAAASAVYLMGAEVAEAEEDWQAAYDLLRAARAAAPKNADYAMREAMTLFFMADHERAATAFLETVPLMLERAEPFFRAAQCRALQQRDEEAEVLLARALGLEPALVLDVDEGGYFDHLRGRPDYEAVLSAARVRLTAERHDA